MKTEEEKEKDAELHRKQSDKKSNLKTTTSDFENAKKKEVSVSFGKSTTYEVLKSESDDGSFMARNLDGKGSPRPVKRVVEERDISDGRTEEEKIRDQMEKEEKEKLEEIRKMNEWRQ